MSQESDRHETAIGRTVALIVNTMPFFIPVALAVGLGTIADNYVDSVFIWGGTKCESSMGLESCVGYVPGGLAVLLVISTVLALPLVVWTGKRIEASERLP